MARTQTLVVALDWPKTAQQGWLFTDALEAEWLQAKERRFDGPMLNIAVTVHSCYIPGNGSLTSIWRRSLRFLTRARVISPASDPWCDGLRVIERDDDPHVIIRLTELA